MDLYATAVLHRLTLASTDCGTNYSNKNLATWKANNPKRRGNCRQKSWRGSDGHKVVAGNNTTTLVHIVRHGYYQAPVC